MMGVLCHRCKIRAPDYQVIEHHRSFMICSECMFSAGPCIECGEPCQIAEFLCEKCRRDWVISERLR